MKPLVIFLLLCLITSKPSSIEFDKEQLQRIVKYALKKLKDQVINIAKTQMPAQDKMRFFHLDSVYYLLTNQRLGDVQLNENKVSLIFAENKLSIYIGNKVTR